MAYSKPKKTVSDAWSPIKRKAAPEPAEESKPAKKRGRPSKKSITDRVKPEFRAKLEGEAGRPLEELSIKQLDDLFDRMGKERGWKKEGILETDS